MVRDADSSDAINDCSSKLWVEVLLHPSNLVFVNIYDEPLKIYDHPFLNSDNFFEDSNNLYSTTILLEGDWATIRFQGRLVWSINMKTIVFARNFRQVDTRINRPEVYGLDGGAGGFVKRDFNHTQYTFFNRENHFGSHPTYLALDRSGAANQVLLHTTWPSAAILRPNSVITWQTLGGHLPFYIHLGHSPKEVNMAYIEMIGLPFSISLMNMGFHIGLAEETKLEVINDLYVALNKADIPFTTFWGNLQMLHGNSYHFRNDKSKIDQFFRHFQPSNRKYLQMVHPYGNQGKLPAKSR